MPIPISTTSGVRFALPGTITVPERVMLRPSPPLPAMRAAVHHGAAAPVEQRPARRWAPPHHPQQRDDRAARRHGHAHPPLPAQYVWQRILESHESCDDGNRLNGDARSQGCQPE